MNSARLLYHPIPIRLSLLNTSSSPILHQSFIKRLTVFKDDDNIDPEDRKLRNLAIIECEMNLRTSWDSNRIRNCSKLISNRAPKRPRNPMVRDKTFESMNTEPDIDIECNDCIMMDR